MTLATVPVIDATGWYEGQTRAHRMRACEWYCLSRYRSICGFYWTDALPAPSQFARRCQLCVANTRPVGL